MLEDVCLPLVHSRASLYERLCILKKELLFTKSEGEKKRGFRGGRGMYLCVVPSVIMKPKNEVGLWRTCSKVEFDFFPLISFFDYPPSKKKKKILGLLRSHARPRMAPEVILAMETGRYSYPVDIWSLGITLIGVHGIIWHEYFSGGEIPKKLDYVEARFFGAFSLFMVLSFIYIYIY